MDNNATKYEDSTGTGESVENDSDVIVGPSHLTDEIFACQFSSWYPVFEKLIKSDNCDGHFRRNVTIRSVIIDLPDTFRNYLIDDNLFLPVGSKTSCILLEDAEQRTIKKNNSWSTESSGENEVNESQDGSIGESIKAEEKKVKVHSFLELNEQIKSAIDSLYSKYEIHDPSEKLVFPKLNWSAPKDSVWVNNGSAKCSTAGDIYMLLKASDFCSHDVNHVLPELELQLRNRAESFQKSKQHKIPRLQLCLRKWCNLYPSQEFRCFVRNDSLIAISQRHDSQHWPHLTDSKIQDEFIILIEDFYDEVILPNLSSSDLSMLHNYAVDVYIDTKKKVWLIDFNVWSSQTDSLLFSWSELEQLQLPPLTDTSNTTLMRVVENPKQIKVNPLSCYKAPIDTLFMASSMRRDKEINELEDCPDIPSQFSSREVFDEFMGMCQKPSSILDCEHEVDHSVSTDVCLLPSTDISSVSYGNKKGVC